MNRHHEFIRPPMPAVVIGGASDEQPPGQRDPRRSPVFDSIARMLRFSAKVGAVPTRTDVAAVDTTSILTRCPDATLPAVYVLRRIEIPGDVADQEVAYSGASWYLRPPTVGLQAVNGKVAYAIGTQDSMIQWGSNINNEQTLLGVGVNIPIAEHRWGQVGVPYPGLMETDLCNAPEENDSSWIELIPFPQGDWGDGVTSPPNIGESNERIGHLILPKPCTLDICLIVRRSYIIVGDTLRRYVCGSGRIVVRLDSTVPVSGQWR